MTPIINRKLKKRGYLMLPEWMWQKVNVLALQKSAGTDRLSASEIIRRAIEEYLAKHGLSEHKG